MRLSRKEWVFVICVFAFLSVLTLLTAFYGGADTFDYQDSASFFAGQYPAKIRSSHSHLYGVLHGWLVGVTDSFVWFKLTSLTVLAALIYSVYRISGKNKYALWLMLLSPIVWYMAPWSSPIQLASLCFLWGYHFIKKYDTGRALTHLFYGGLLIGVSWAFWDGVLFFIPLFLISFLYNEKLLHSIYVLFFIMLGTLPRTILDFLLFDSVFFTPLRHLMASLALTFIGGFYNQGGLWGFIPILFVTLFLPLGTYLLAKKELFQHNRKMTFFIGLSILLLIINSQIRFVLLIAPIIITAISPHLTKKQFIAQIMYAIVLILLVINPYILQTRWDLGIDEKGVELYSFVVNADNITFNEQSTREIIQKDLEQIDSTINTSAVVVGNTPDDYRILANLYTGDTIEEFVSIEDYQLAQRNDSVIARKDFCTAVRINERRDLCFSASIHKAFNDATDYEGIRYAITRGDTFDVPGFTLVQKYELLSLWKKST